MASYNPHAAVPSDMYSTALFLRDQLVKVEERCKAGQEKSERLKMDRAALCEAVKWFELLEQNEKNATHSLRKELATLESEQARGFWPPSPLKAPSRRPTYDDPPSPVFFEGPKPSLLERLHADVKLTPFKEDMLSLLAGEVRTSAPSALRRILPSTWKSKITQLGPDVCDDFDSLTLLGQNAPLRAFGRAADSRCNARTASKATYRLTKPKLHSETAPRKTISRRQSTKPFIPILFSKARMERKKNMLTALRISGPLLATPILREEGFKEPIPGDPITSSRCAG